MSKIKTLTEFAQALDAGEKFEIKLPIGDEWASVNFSATKLANIQRFIAEGTICIKQKPQKIDMEPFIVNGLDCAFTDNTKEHWRIGRLTSISNGRDWPYELDHTNSYEYCRPRLDHPFLWSDNLELPEGLVVEYGFFNGEELEWSDIPKNAHLARILGCKEGYCFDGEDK